MQTSADKRFLDGPFRGSDAIASGVLTRADLRSGSFRPLFHGVHAPVALPVTHALKARAATLVVPDGAVVTGASAAAVHGLDLTRRDDPVEVVATEQNRFGPVRGIRVVRSDVPLHHARQWEGARLATPLRLSYDWLRRLPLPWAVGTADALLRAHLLDAPQLADLAVSRRDRGVPVVRRALELADARAESIPESVVRTLLVLDGLLPVPQLPVTVADGSVYRVDLGFARQRVAVEYDGAWHAHRTQMERDRTRQNALQAAGWYVITLTAADLRQDLQLIAAQVRAVLAGRS